MKLKTDKSIHQALLSFVHLDATGMVLWFKKKNAVSKLFYDQTDNNGCIVFTEQFMCHMFSPYDRLCNHLLW